jgi:hypothetical protein
MDFHIGDNVRLGAHVGTITDIGTVLIQVETTEGCAQLACPWELVKARDRSLRPSRTAIWRCPQAPERITTNEQHLC